MESVRRWGGWLLAAVAALGCSSSSSNNNNNNDAGLMLNVPSPAWEEQVVYFVMTDRFNDGDTTNDNQGKGEFDPTNKDKYSGGDLQGIIAKLDYIQGTGATALWITPPVANMWWDPLQQSGGYHGYWARHLKKVDEHAGTLDTYKALSDGLHRRGMYLIQDVVPNHMGNFFTYSSYDPSDVTKNVIFNTQAVPTAKAEQSPFDQNDVTDPVQRDGGIYHWTPTITDYLDPHQELFYQVSDLDDLNSENPVTRTALRDSYGYWIKQVGVDAFRVDTVKYVPHDFWNDFFWSTAADAPGMMAVAQSTGRNRFFAFGEIYQTSDPFDDAADIKVASYLGDGGTPELPSVLGYPLYSEITRVFSAGQPSALMTYRLGRLMDPALYPNPYAIPTFIDNHDNPRFLAAGNLKATIQALAFIFTIPGIPIVYYGTEQDFTETRASMFAAGWGAKGDSFSPGDRYAYLKRLADIRKSSPAFTHGTLNVLYDNPSAPGVFAYRRAHGGDVFYVVMNTSDETALMSGLPTGLDAGTQLKVVDAENFGTPVPAGTKITVGEGGILVAVLPNRTVQILQATSEVITVPPPGATITVSTAIDGQTFTDDVTVNGTVSPASTALKMVIDGNFDALIDVPVNQQNGTWSVVMPVSTFPTGTGDPHSVAFYAPAVNVSTPLMKFTSSVAFLETTISQDDPVGDDKGPFGTYTYPQDPSFSTGRYMDITKVVAEVGRTTMLLHITMKDWSVVWNPQFGFDHVGFSIFFGFPGQAGLSVLPKLNASMPGGFTWSLNQFTYGWDNKMYDTQGASATSYGNSARPPTVSADQASKTVTFTYNRKDYGLSTWTGVKVYITTWDYDGIGSTLRPLSPTGGQWTFGGGQPTDPLIIDDTAVISLPAPP